MSGHTSAEAFARDIAGYWKEDGDLYHFSIPDPNKMGKCTITYQHNKANHKPFQVIPMQSGFGFELGDETCLVEKLDDQSLHFWCGGRLFQLKRSTDL